MVWFTESSSENSQGLDFAKKQLQKHGWSKGKGLGKDENGMANAIKVGVKKDTLGVGFDVGKEFTHHWWDHMFNKAASNIVVEQSENGIHVKKKESTDLTRPKKMYRVKGQNLYYGRFVKASNGNDDTDESKDDIKAKSTDEELLKACGGRTGHKSARHGHQLSGKLKRVAEQESIDVNNESSGVIDENLDRMESVMVNERTKKKRKKKVLLKLNEIEEVNDIDIASNATILDNGACFVANGDSVTDSSNGADLVSVVTSGNRKKKKKRKHKELANPDEQQPELVKKNKRYKKSKDIDDKVIKKKRSGKRKNRDKKAKQKTTM